jgi:peptide/nickel transport system ATP-binding protein
VARRGWFGRAGTHIAVDAVDLTVHEGETVAVVGGSGSGKTTLGRAMLRLARASGGEVRFKGGRSRAAALRCNLSGWPASSCSRIRTRH